MTNTLLSVVLLLSLASYAILAEHEPTVEGGDIFETTTRKMESSTTQMETLNSGEVPKAQNATEQTKNRPSLLGELPEMAEAKELQQQQRSGESAPKSTEKTQQRSPMHVSGMDETTREQGDGQQMETEMAPRSHEEKKEQKPEKEAEHKTTVADALKAKEEEEGEETTKEVIEQEQLETTTQPPKQPRKEEVEMLTGGEDPFSQAAASTTEAPVDEATKKMVEEDKMANEEHPTVQMPETSTHVQSSIEVHHHPEVAAVPTPAESEGGEQFNEQHDESATQHEEHVTQVLQVTDHPPMEAIKGEQQEEAGEEKAHEKIGTEQAEEAPMATPSAETTTVGAAEAPQPTTGGHEGDELTESVIAGDKSVFGADGSGGGLKEMGEHDADTLPEPERARITHMSHEGEPTGQKDPKGEMAPNGDGTASAGDHLSPVHPALNDGSDGFEVITKEEGQEGGAHEGKEEPKKEEGQHHLHGHVMAGAEHEMEENTTMQMPEMTAVTGHGMEAAAGEEQPEAAAPEEPKMAATTEQPHKSGDGEEAGVGHMTQMSGEEAGGELAMPTTEQAMPSDEVAAEMPKAMVPEGAAEPAEQNTTSVPAPGSHEEEVHDHEQQGEESTEVPVPGGHEAQEQDTEATRGDMPDGHGGTTMVAPHEEEATTELSATAAADDAKNEKEEKGAETKMATEMGNAVEEEQQHTTPEVTTMSAMDVQQRANAFRTPFTIHLVEIEWRPTFEDPQSGDSVKLREQIAEDLRHALLAAIGSTFLDFEIVKLRKGSVIVEAEALTKEEIPDAQGTALALEQAIASNGGKLGPNVVDTDGLSVAGLAAHASADNTVAANQRQQQAETANTGYIIGGAVVVGVLIVTFAIFAIVVFGVNNRRNNGTLKLKEEICMVENGKGGARRFSQAPSDGGVNLTGLKTTGASGAQNGHSNGRSNGVPQPIVLSGSQFSTPGAYTNGTGASRP